MENQLNPDWPREFLNMIKYLLSRAGEPTAPLRGRIQNEKRKMQNAKSKMQIFKRKIT